MTARLRLWFAALSPRERWMVTAAAVLAALVLAWGLVVPLLNGLAEVRAAHREAVIRHGRIAAKVATVRTAPRAAVAQADAGPLPALVAASAAERGFTLDTSDARGADRIVIAIGSARPPALFAWLQALETQGIRVATLRVQPAADGTVAMNAELARGTR